MTRYNYKVDHKATYVVLSDEGKRLLHRYGVRATPMAVLDIKSNSVGELVYVVSEECIPKGLLHPMFVTVISRKQRQYPIP